MTKREIAVVTWHDPFSISDNHVDESSKRLITPYVRRSVGWLIRRRPLVIALTRDLDEDAAGGTLSHTLTVPNSLVKKLTVLEVDDD